MLFTKCIYDPPDPRDGIRICVMSRITLSDGKTPEPRITKGCYHIHLSFLGPPPSLAGDYIKRKCINWEEFKERYLNYIRKNLTRKVLLFFIAFLSMFKNITFLCVENTADSCHRGLLAEEIKNLFYFFPISVIHR